MGNSQSRVKNFQDTGWTIYDVYKRDNVRARVRAGESVIPSWRLSKAKRLANRKKLQAKLASAASSAQALQDTDALPFRFLDLPQELQDAIYRYHLHECDVFCLIEKGGFIAQRGNLNAVCKEIRSQLLAMVTNPAPVNIRKLVCTVCDFEFKAAVEALKWFESSTGMLTTTQQRPILTLQLCVSETWKQNRSLYGLPEWQRFVNENLKHGLGVDIEYVFGSIDNVEQNDRSNTSVWPGMSDSFQELLYRTLSFVAWDDIQTGLFLDDMMDVMYRRGRKFDLFGIDFQIRDCWDDFESMRHR